MAHKPKVKVCQLDSCGREFSGRRGPAKFCSPECSAENLRRYQATYHVTNAEKKNTYGAQWRKDNAERCRDYEYMRRYGVSAVFVDAEMASGCRVCGRLDDLHVDHDHKTGAYRGILCSGHNKGIGFFGDSPELLLAAAAYLIATQESVEVA